MKAKTRSACFESGHAYVDGIYVDYYELMVSDITGEQPFITTIYAPNNCTKEQ